MSRPATQNVSCESATAHGLGNQNTWKGYRENRGMSKEKVFTLARVGMYPRGRQNHGEDQLSLIKIMYRYGKGSNI